MLKYDFNQNILIKNLMLTEWFGEYPQSIAWCKSNIHLCSTHCIQNNESAN